MINSIIEILKSETLWQSVAAALAASGGYMGKRLHDKKKEEKTIYDRLDEYREKFIELNHQQIEIHDKYTKIQKLLNEIKNECPECYNTIIAEL